MGVQGFFGLVMISAHALNFKASAKISGRVGLWFLGFPLEPPHGKEQARRVLVAPRGSGFVRVHNLPKVWPKAYKGP